MSPSKPSLLQLGLLAGACAAAGKLALLWTLPPLHLVAIWPAAGIALASCLAFGQRVWPALWLGILLAHWGAPGMTPALALSAASSQTLAAVLAGWLVRRYTRIDYTQVEHGFQRGGDVFRFAAIALGAALTGSLPVAAALLIGGNPAAAPYPSTWLAWVLADLTGILLAAPALLTWRGSRWRDWPGARRLELLALTLLFLGCSTLVFIDGSKPLLYLLLPFSFWLAFRFSQAELAKANLVLAAFAIGGTLGGTGPLVVPLFDSVLLPLQLFLIVTSVAGLAMAVIVEERSRAARRLQQIQGELERLVTRRTLELTAIADTLHADIAMHKETQAALEARDQQLEEAQRLAHLGSWEWDVVNDRLTMSAEMKRIYNIAPAEEATMSLRKYLAYIPEEECPLVHDVVQAALATRLPFSYEHHVIRPDGMLRYLRCSGSATLDVHGNALRLYGTAHDITEEKALETSLRETEELYRKLVELSPDAIFLLRDGRCAFHNSTLLKLMRADGEQQLLGRPFLDFIAPEQRRETEDALSRLHLAEMVARVETRIVRLDAATIDIELAATPFGTHGAHGTQEILLVARDISERKRAEQQIQYMAHHDTLTGLANRVLFKERLEHALANVQRNGRPLFVLFIDLDRFKAINDTAGHDAGDAVLRQCAQRLRGCLRDSDTVARAGGDEFLVLIESAGDARDVPGVAHKILAAMRMPFEVDGKEFTIGASLGISSVPDDGGDVESLIRHADIAMYRAKSEGKGNFRYYSAAMTRQSMERYAMEAALRRALEREQMELHFQPKIDLRSGRMSGAEALIRWNHPELGMLLPSRFIALAEDTFLIGQLGMWAIAETCRCCREWRQQGLPEIRIAVNLSYAQFADERFFCKTEQLLRSSGLQPGTLELEITESMVMENAESLMETLQQFRKLGVHLSVDDFGTGYSSLAYLKRLPVDSVKVDRSFIKDLPGDAEDVAITRAVLALVHSLKRSVVAEGVETREQLRFLVDNGCDHVQGFYFSPALPDREFRRLLAEERSFAI